MDIEGLQRTLREFAAERNWQPFHTPKNLAMALMVEAAELAEIFQWMTPEESRKAHTGASAKQNIADELADVMLYLLQVADHTEVDLRLAVREKLIRNGEKYPPARKTDMVVATKSATHVLLDYENVQPTEEELRALIPEATNVWVFHGPHQKQVEQRFASYGNGMTAVPISKTGKNALDFHLSFYMGYIASRNQEASLVVVANDTGYGPMLDHAKAMGFAARQLGHAREVKLPKESSKKPVEAVKAPVKKKPATKKAADAKAAPAKKIPSKKAPAKKGATKVAAKKVVKPSPQKKVSAPTMVQKMVDGLRKMGSKRPGKVTALRRALKPFLGATASEAAVEAAFTKLVAAGAVAAGSNGEATYPLFEK